MSSNAPGIVKRSNSYFIDPTFVVRKEGFNPRFDFGKITELAASIKSNGVLNPIRVKRAGDKFELVDGDRRMTAIELLLKEGHEFPEGIPAIILDKALSDVESLIQMFEANTGKAFLPLEEAEAYKRMRDAGMTIKVICERVGRAHVHVTNTLALLTADEEVKAAVKDGSIGGTLAKQIAVKAKGNKEKQKELVAKAKTGKAGKKAVKEEAEKIQRRPTKKTSQQQIAEPKTKVINVEKLRELEGKVIGQMAEMVKALGLQEDTIKPFVQGSDETTAAYYFGVLLGIRSALGYDVPVIL